METNGVVINLAKKLHAYEVAICESRGKEVDYKTFNELDENGTFYIELAQRLLADLVLNK